MTQCAKLRRPRGRNVARRTVSVQLRGSHSENMFSPPMQNQRRPAARFYRPRGSNAALQRPAIIDALPRQLCAAIDQSRMSPPLIEALATLRTTLSSHAQSHDSAARKASPALWREAVCTALLAVCVARLLDCSSNLAALAGLLHRVDEFLAPDGAGDEKQFREHLLQSWRLPAATAAAIRNWRRFGEGRRMSRESIAVYVAHLLANEFLHPEISSPGMAASVSAEFGISNDSLELIRQQFQPLYLRGIGTP